ncbi:MAG TPA: hypothetical protein DDZ90_21080, partial [Planctomycetaceae bacterium]|nr:hypothetical protein [Planctomycetaceae bacterium]
MKLSVSTRPLFFLQGDCHVLQRQRRTKGFTLIELLVV